YSLRFDEPSTTEIYTLSLHDALPIYGGRMGRTACRWFLALGLLGSLTAHAAGPVWAVRGAHNTVYLAGSVHLLPAQDAVLPSALDRKSTRLNSSHVKISYAVFCLKKK